MSEQPEALRMADLLEAADGVMSVGDDLNIAAELRRLHQSEREGWRYAGELEQDNANLREQNTMLDAKLAELEQPRPWQGLTEAEHTQIAVDSGCASADWVFYGAAVERKLKAKNT